MLVLPLRLGICYAIYMTIKLTIPRTSSVRSLKHRTNFTPPFPSRGTIRNKTSSRGWAWTLIRLHVHRWSRLYYIYGCAVFRGRDSTGGHFCSVLYQFLQLNLSINHFKIIFHGRSTSFPLRNYHSVADLRRCSKIITVTYKLWLWSRSALRLLHNHSCIK